VTCLDYSNSSSSSRRRKNGWSNVRAVVLQSEVSLRILPRNSNSIDSNGEGNIINNCDSHPGTKDEVADIQNGTINMTAMNGDDIHNKNSNSNLENISDGNQSQTPLEGRPQYRIRSINSDEDQFRYHPIIRGIAWLFDTHQNFISNASSDYLRWAFTVSFLRLALSIFVHFLLLALFFAILIYGIAQNQPNCIYAGATDFDDAGSDYVDAFQLSWTTLSTVGYGAIGPKTPAHGQRWYVL
jgi:Ion channel